MNGDIIALAEDILQIGNIVCGVIEVKCRFDRQIGVITVYLHTKIACGIGNHGTDGAKSEEKYHYEVQYHVYDS